MTIHARTAFHNQTRSDPHLNTVRTTTEALSAVLGGADSLETNAYDESFSNPDRFSRRLARNIQLILYHEAHLQQPIDPAGGAHFVEKLTRDIAREAWSIFQAIEKQGGMAESLKTGSIQKRISKIKARKMADVFCLKTGIVGSNIYCLQPEKPDDPGESDTGSPARGGFQEPVKEQEKSTDKTKCRSILSRLSQVPAQDEPEIVARGAEAFLCGCTLGEIVETLNIRGAPGDSVSPVEIERFSEPFEGLREKMDRHIRETGHRPEIFLLLLDSSSQARSGAELARRILEIAGFGILFSEEIPDHESLPEGVIPSTVRAVVVCSDDADSEGTLESIGRLKQRRPESVIALCGYPEKNRVKLQEMGVDIYLNPRGDAFRILKNLMARLGFIPE